MLDGVAEDNDAIVLHVLQNSIFQVPHQHQSLIPHGSFVPLLGCQDVEVIWRDVHQHMLAQRADLMQACTFAPHQRSVNFSLLVGLLGRLLATACASGLVGSRGHLLQVRGRQTIEALQLVPRRLVQRGRDKCPLHLHAGPRADLRDLQKLVLQEHVHLVEDHGPAPAEVQGVFCVLVEKISQATRRHDHQIWGVLRKGLAVPTGT
mmetsp:Transcript_35567/g.102245  ORF Transcript_35567/g.102245 Transcript_35567/m.102245 type:complete len:206 (-) Transcript_35567:394-1011(-)